MPREQLGLTQFNRGEWSPLMEGRFDLDGYNDSCRLLQNMIPTAFGPPTRRPGFQYVSGLKSNSVKGRAVDFRHSATAALLLEFGDQIIRFYKDRARVVVADVGTAITNGDFPTGITSWTDRSIGAGASISHDATLDRLNLTPGGATSGDVGWAEQAVTVAAGDQAKEHVLAFDIEGLPGDRVEFRVGTSSTGEELIDDFIRGPGTHLVAFTPNAATVYVQFRARGDHQNKTVQIDNVRFLDNEPLELKTPYLEADLYSIKKTQSNDVATYEHPEYWPRDLTRYGDSTFSLEQIDFEDGPYLPENTTATTLTPSAATGYGITLTASSKEGINGGRGFLSTDVGRAVRMKEGTVQGWGRVKSVTSTTVVTFDVRATLTNINAKTVWRLGLWSDTTGFPRHGVYHQERLAFDGAAIEDPQRNEASKTGDFHNFTPGVADDDPLSLSLAGDAVNAPQWLASKKGLISGTTGKEIRLTGDTDRAALTPTNINASKETAVGSADLEPLDADDLLFVQLFGRRVHAFEFSIEIEGMRSPDLTRLAEHITLTGITTWAFQRHPWRLAWATRGDGLLIAGVISREEEVVAWAREPVGGVFQGGAVAVESVAVIPGADFDEVWITVKRTVNGATARTMEVMSEPFDHDVDQADAIHVDSALSLDNPIALEGATAANPVVLTLPAGHGLANADVVRITDVKGMTQLNGNTYTLAGVAATTAELNDDSGATINGAAFTAYAAGGNVRKKVSSVTGADHLVAETVQIWGDGGRLDDAVVSGAGAVTLSKPASIVHLGLQCKWRLQPQRLNPRHPAGTSQGRKKRIDGLGLRVYRTLGVLAGEDEATLKEIKELAAHATYGKPPALASGDFKMTPRVHWSREGDLLLGGDGPAPATIVALMPSVETED
ncbi:MAG: hypothetical protein U1A72_13290 [Sulfuritalea sp.]|nr:hypothetical protein [Sulfuritalea sp.]